MLSSNLLLAHVALGFTGILLGPIAMLSSPIIAWLVRHPRMNTA